MEAVSRLGDTLHREGTCSRWSLALPSTGRQAAGHPAGTCELCSGLGGRRCGRWSCWTVAGGARPFEMLRASERGPVPAGRDGTPTRGPLPSLRGAWRCPGLGRGRRRGAGATSPRAPAPCRPATGEPLAVSPDAERSEPRHRATQWHRPVDFVERVTSCLHRRTFRLEASAVTSVLPAPHGTLTSM